MITESLLYLASLVDLPHWLLGTVDMLNNPLVSAVLEYFLQLAVEAFFTRLWRIVRPHLSQWWESFKAWFKGPRASTSTSTTSTSCAASTSTASTSCAASPTTCAARAAGLL